MVIKNRLVLSILIAALFAGALPVMAAQLHMPEEEMPERSDKDEKVGKEAAQEEEAVEAEKKILRGLEKRIPFEIPDRLKLKDKNGKIKEEFLESLNDDIFSFEPFADVINHQLDQNKHPLIARVYTKMPDGAQEAHYFTIDGIWTEIKGSRGFVNPCNRQQIRNLSYFFYVPEFKKFIWAADSASNVSLTFDQLQEYADYTIATRFTKDSDPVQKERGITKLIHLSDTATIKRIKNYARFDLALLYLKNEGTAKKARDLLLSLVNIPGKVSVSAHARLAIGYFTGYGEWLQDTERAFVHALHAINHPDINHVKQDIRAHVYCIAGELCIKYHNNPISLGFEPQPYDALSLLKQALKIARLPEIKARVHACLALCYYSDPVFGKGRYTEGDDGRYARAWYHCTNALQEYEHESVKDVLSFFDLVAIMRYFALGNEGDAKKALEHIKQSKKINPEVEDMLKLIIHHRKYWHTENKKEALKAIQKLAGDHQKDVLYERIAALLGEMYVHESQDLLKKAELYAVTDPAASLKYNNEGQALQAKANTLLTKVIEESEKINVKNPSYEWALAHLTLGRLELLSPSKDYEKAKGFFEKICAYQKEFPLLASNAYAELYELERAKKSNQESFANGVITKDPRYCDVQYEEARSTLNGELVIGDMQQDTDTIFGVIINDFDYISQYASNPLLRMQARKHMEIAREQRALVGEADEAIMSQNEQAAVPYLKQLLASPNKHIRKSATEWLHAIEIGTKKEKSALDTRDGEHKERAASAALPAAAPQPRANKRKNYGEPVGKSPVSKVAKHHDNGAGSGSRSAAELDHD